MIGRRAPAHPAALRRANAVGRGVIVDGRLDVENLGALVVGDAVRIGGAAAPTHFVTGPGAQLTVGRGARIAHGVGVAAHAGITIGEGAVLGPFTLVLDTDFHAAGDHQGAGTSAPIVIEAGARLGARVTVLRGARVGANAHVAAGSVVTGDVPAGARVAGNPARPADATSNHTAGEAVTPDAVRAVVATTLALPTPPRDDQGPHDLRGWDSLGALTLLLALEETFGVTLDPGALAGARTVGALASAVSTAHARTGAPA